MKSSDFLVILFSLIIGWHATSGKKTQFVRLVDVFAYGPFLIYLGFKFENNLIRNMLFFMGCTTMTYNLKNYIEESRRQ